jgi:hypothetical protein
MLLPHIGSWVKQTDPVARLRIDAFRPVTSCQVARRTGQRAVLDVVGTTLGNRDEMFQMKAVTAGSL